MLKSKFNKNIYFYLLAASSASFLLSLFLLQLFVGLLALMWLWETSADKRKAADIFTTLIAAFGLIRIISVIFSQYPGVSVQSFYKDALFYLGFFSMSFYLKALEYGKLKSVLGYFSLASVVVALIGLLLFNLSIVDRAQSFTSGYSTFSSYLIAALGIIIAVPVRIKIKSFELIRPFAVSIIISGVITSLGRTNMAIAGLLIIAGIIFKKIDIRSFLVIVIATAALSGLSFYNNRVEVKQRMENPTALSDRDILMKGFNDLKFEHPLLGFGPRTFHQIFPYKDEFKDVGIGSWHNDFIQVYFESGLLGLAAFMAIIFFVFYYCYRFLKKEKSSAYLYDIVLGVVLGFAALVLSSLTAGFIDSPVLSVIFAFFISVLSAALYHKNDTEAEDYVKP